MKEIKYSCIKVCHGLYEINCEACLNSSIESKKWFLYSIIEEKRIKKDSLQRKLLPAETIIKTMK